MTRPAGSAAMAEGELFGGHFPRECGEHRTVGPHRAWCHDCGEWCYPDAEMACKGCRIPMLEARARLAADRARPEPPGVWSFTRPQLIDALRRRRPLAPLGGPVTVLEGDAVFEAMADAIIEALEDGESAPREGRQGDG